MTIHYSHILPQIGPVNLTLYAPADKIYERLLTAREINRLNGLRHLGALSVTALTGARLARWDYTVALLHYSEQFSLPKFNSRFNIGRVEFSSTIAALQCASLIWNIGHLPGTFSVEKGVCRNLKRKNPRNPAGLLEWPFINNPDIQHIQDQANRLISNNDYLGVCRVLAVIKLLSICKDTEDELYAFTIDFAAPLLLGYTHTGSKQWPKINKSFSLIRHLSYLTVDLPFSGHSWAPNISEMLKHHIELCDGDVDILSEKISELLSPIEKNIYDAMYHSDTSRKETSIYANLVDLKLSTSRNPGKEISRWLKSGLSRDLKLGRAPRDEKIYRFLNIKLRDHFSSHPDSFSDVEFKLMEKGFTHPAVFKYSSWNSDTLFEPDELIVDVLGDRKPTPKDIGKIAYWFLSEFENFTVNQNDIGGLLRKKGLDPSYVQIFSKAVEAHFPGVTVKIEPWPLNRFGKFSKFQIDANKGGIWASSSKLDDPIISHIFWGDGSDIPTDLNDTHSELLGLKATRDAIRKEMKGLNPKCRWLVLTSSVTFCREGRSLIEYDGGLLKISSRSGELTWYGVETKTGGENPARSLRKRLSTLNINSPVISLSTKTAYTKIVL